MYNFVIGIIVITVLALIITTDASAWALLMSLGTTASMTVFCSFLFYSVLLAYLHIATLLSWSAIYALKLWRIHTKKEKRFKKGKIASVKVSSGGNGQ